MHLTTADREELVRRVLERARGTGVRRAAVREAVERAVSTAGPPCAVPPRHVVVAHRSSTPDLASRWRRALPDALQLSDVAIATEGSHTVVAARVAVDQVEVAAAAARDIGADVVVREDM